jgi:hypothetical protein
VLYLNSLSFKIKITLFAIVSLLFQGIMLLIIIKNMNSAVGIMTVSYLSTFLSCGLFIFLGSMFSHSKHQIDFENENPERYA